MAAFILNLRMLANLKKTPAVHRVWATLKNEIIDPTLSYKDRISYSIIRDKRSRRIYKFYKKWSNLEGWKQLFFSTPPERLPVRCEFRTQAWALLLSPGFDH